MLGGLVDKVDLFRYTTSDDGAGGFEESGETSVKTSLKVRTTLLTAEAQLRDLGYSGKNCWKLISEPYTGLDNEGDLFLRVTPGTTNLKLDENRVYRVLKLAPQYDEFGRFHHISIWTQQNVDKDA